MPPEAVAEKEISSASIEQILAKELAVTREQVWAAIKLLDAGATVPFISRYRKEATGGLTDTHLRMLDERLEFYRELEKRRIEVRQSLEDQGKLSDSLKSAIEKARTLSELEDIYLPFKPKKHSKAQEARDRGLEPLADLLYGDPRRVPETEAQVFVNPDKAVPDAAAALAGARDILIERFSEDAELAAKLREKFWREAWLVSKKNEFGAPKAEEVQKFSDYFSFREPAAKLPSHRVLALLRGRAEKALSLSLVTDGYADYRGEKGTEDAEYLAMILQRFGIAPARRAADAWLFETVRQTWKYRLRIRLELDLFMRLREAAGEEAIRVFAQNLKNLLLAAPAGSRVTMGLDPGFRTGVKVAVVNGAGKVVATGAVFPHPPDGDRERAIQVLAANIRQYGVELIAIGNGTASRETDLLVGELLKRYPELKAVKVLVSEAGASVYSASELAAREHPDLDVTLRGAVSIARRLQDPLAELVKIEPKSIGVGQYQHDVNQVRLARSLRGVVEDCVNAVGVDINTASPSLLSYVSGLNKSAAENLVRYRETHGLFKDRSELLKVPELGPRTFEQAAGFLRVPAGQNPLDRTGVHPEAYPVVERILAATGKPLTEVMGRPEVLDALDPEAFTDERFGLPTVEDILEELEKPGRDPRPEFKTASFREDVTTLDDLKPGMTLEGTVTNVANFGAFVDIGVHQDGLVHISELSDSFVKDPHAFVRAGQTVRVRVLEVDKTRKRIALSMRHSAGKASR